MQPQHRGDRTSLSRTHPTLARSSPPTGLSRPPSPTTGRPGSRPPESPAPYARRNSVEPNWLAQPCRSASPPESSQRCLHANRRPQRQSARTLTAPQQRARSAQCRTPRDHRALRSLPIKHDGHGIRARRRMPRAARHTQRDDGASLARRRQQTVCTAQLAFAQATTAREDD